MKIAIIGYGKMGRLIEKIALSRGHEIVAVIDKDNTTDLRAEPFLGADVAIEFSTPATGYKNIIACFEGGIPVVSGTTGFSSSLPELKAMCEKGEGTLLHATNFSIGVNIFRALNRYLASVMNDFPSYKPYLTEIHHIQKLDHPSGTAITLAEELAQSHFATNGWHEPLAGVQHDSASLPVNSVREGEVPGTHTISWVSDVDTISITHSAKSREGFALGAVKAAEWIFGKKGYFTMSQMLSDITHTENLFT